jgi:FK506-binding nuclear protein
VSLTTPRWKNPKCTHNRFRSLTESSSSYPSCSRFEEITEAPKKKETKKIATTPVVATPETKKRKAEEPASAEKPGNKKAEKKDNKKPVVAEKKKDEKPEQQGSKKKTLPSGLVIEDVKIGDGAIAKKGKRCGMR